MNYQDPDLRDKLAADYVSGVMRGGARRRFERLMRDDGALRQVVVSWEERIYPLAGALPPEMPRDAVWQSIRKRLQSRDHGRGRAGAGWSLAGANFWRAISGVLAAALVAVVVTQPLVEPDEAPAMAVLQDPESRAHLLVAALPGGAMRVEALDAMRPAQTGQVFELWALMPGGTPRSLGLLNPDGRLAAPLPQGAHGMTGLAVSVEPTGGSPTGQPTGPVILSGNLVHL